MTTREAFEAALEQVKAGRPAEAEALCRQILKQERSDAALHLLGLICGQSGRINDAIACITQAIALNPNVAAYHNNLGEAYRRAGRLGDAVASYRDAIRCSPRYGRCYRNLSLVLTAMGQTGQAVVAARTACEIDPADAETHDNLAAALAANGDPDSAITSANEAVRLDPSRATAHANLGAILVELGRPNKALAELGKAVELDSSLSKAHWNLGLALLLLGDFRQGWAEYEWRWKCDSLGVERGFSQPMWKAEMLAGRTILLHAEQGLGDTLQFARYAPLVAARGGRVIVECHPELAGLLQGMDGVAQVVRGGEAIPPFDVYCPLLSLPRVFETQLNSIPANVPYLAAEKHRVEGWSKRISEREAAGSERTLRVGLVWAGSPGHKNDRNRSMSLQQLEPLKEVAGVQFYSLQRGPASTQAAHPPGIDLVDWSNELHDMSDTAALASCLDLVISVDTAVAHLAGALGKSVWTLLPHVPDWRWMLDRSDSPWYPTMKLFRQPARGDWQSVIRNVAAELSRFKPRA